MAFRSGFVSIIGRPNAGKSTLLNALVGEKLAIVTRKPQTTRNRIQGIVNVERKGKRPSGQIVLVDTPGVHKPINSLNRRMMKEVYDALEACDLLLLIVDASEKFGAGDKFVLDIVKRSAQPCFLLLNKIDKLEKQRLLPLIAEYEERQKFAEVIPISAMKRQGLDTLLDAVIKTLPEGPRYFPKDQVTDQPERFLVAELIREQVLLATEQEVPYATTVLIEQYEESGKLTRVAATIYCERDGQKAILIGKQGANLKKIGTAARLQIQKLLNTKVYLELFVKVRPGWRDSRDFVQETDWRTQLQRMSQAVEVDEPVADPDSER
ncbi:MAG: GTPase Era [Candidatus Korobacteraceae bacterium]|jgi:GTP-binding protein Era